MKIKSSLILLAICTIIAVSCTEHKNEMKNAIKTALKNVNKGMDAGNLDKVAVAKADSLMMAYIDKYPKDTITPDFILKTAQLQQMQKNYSEANKLLDKLVNDYPDSKAAPVGLYLNGFIYENDEFLLDKAKARYELFLQKYPDNELAKSVRTSLQYLGKSPDDILKNAKVDTARVPA